MESIVKMHNVSFGYGSGKVRPLNGVTLEIQQGSIFGLIGKNGAGKTTLMQILFGNLKPESGEIEICGVKQAKLPRHKLGFVTERPFYHLNFRLREYLTSLNHISAVQRSTDEIDELIRFVHLQDFAETYLREYSKGMLQRVGIAQALLNNPEFLILDEPMSGLDVVGQDLMRDVILRIHQQGMTVLISSHNLYEIERLCDQIGVLHRGRLMQLTREQLDIHSEYCLTLELSEERLIKEYHALQVLGNFTLEDGQIRFPAETDQYFATINFLTERGVQIRKMETTGPSLEKFLLKYLSEEGERA